MHARWVLLDLDEAKLWSSAARSVANIPEASRNFSSRVVLVSAFEPTIGLRGPLYLADPSMSAAGRCGHFN
jgi:hypothetical protein